jgi:hypothetical protein
MPDELLLERILEELRAHGCNPKRSGNGFRARCPAHDDLNPSLSLGEGDDGRILVHCHAGCDTSAVLGALGLVMRDLFTDRDPEHDDGIVATYDYTDAEGRLLYQVVRRIGHRFAQRRPDGRGGWIPNAKGVTRVPYRLGQLLSAMAAGGMVFVVEGEKDAESLARLGLVATTNAMGAGKWPAEWGRTYLAGASVVVLGDNDDAGRAHVLDVVRSVLPHATEVRTIELAGLADKGDVTDWLVAGHDVDELLALVESTPPVDGTADGVDRLRFFWIADLAAVVDARGHPRFLLRGIWPEGDYGVIGGPEKAGKSWAVGMDLAVSVASGTPWLGIFEVDAPGPVVLFVGEGGERKVVRRMRAVCEARSLELELLPIRTCLRVPHLSDGESMALVKKELDATRPALVIVDPLYLAARGAKGSDLYEMGSHLERIQLLCQSCRTSLVVSHHWNKTGAGTGAERFSGTGPAAWGRVLISAAPVGRSYEDPATGATSVVLDLWMKGDEIPDRVVRIRRRVWEDDPGDLLSPLHYEVTQLERESDDPRVSGRPPAERKVFAVLLDGRERTVREIGDEIAARFGPLTRQTIQKSLQALDDDDLVDSSQSGPGKPAARWWIVGEEAETSP